MRMQSETNSLNKERTFLDVFCDEKYNIEREIFIKKCIELIRLKRFSSDLLEEVSKVLGWDKNYYKILFSENISDVAIEIEKTNDLVIDNAKFAKEESWTNIGTTKKIIALLQVRIINEEIPKSSIISMNAFYKSFSGVCPKIKSSYNTVDKIWKFIDDKSLDFSYYSKRMILFGLYEKAKNFYINKDDSRDSDLTKKYIEEIVVESVAKMFSIVKIFKRI